LRCAAAKESTFSKVFVCTKRFGWGFAVEEDQAFAGIREQDPPRRRVIPTAVKIEVWKRDSGRCVICGANDHLHFDHDVPWSKGGASITVENVQLLCARHNLAKHNTIL
jgi:hypothetical protein